IHLPGTGADGQTIRAADVTRPGLAPPEELVTAVGRTRRRWAGDGAVLALVAARFHRHCHHQASEPSAAVSVDHARKRVLPFRLRGSGARSKMALGRRAGADRAGESTHPPAGRGDGVGSWNGSHDIRNIPYAGISQLLLPGGISLAAR